MALTKVTKHVIFGSQIVQHVSRDISDKTHASSSWSSWGQSLSLQPQYADSHLEIVFTGSVYTGSSINTSSHTAHLRIQVNGQTEYTYENCLGGRNSYQGNQRIRNGRYNEHNYQQEWNASMMASGVYMNHIHAPGTTNNQSVQIQIYVTAAYSVNCYDGFLTVTEIAGDHHNLT
jgi:hypothetical protein